MTAGCSNAHQHFSALIKTNCRDFTTFDHICSPFSLSHYHYVLLLFEHGFNWAHARSLVLARIVGWFFSRTKKSAFRRRFLCMHEVRADGWLVGNVSNNMIIRKLFKVRYWCDVYFFVGLWKLEWNRRWAMTRMGWNLCLQTWVVLLFIVE